MQLTFNLVVETWACRADAIVDPWHYFLVFYIHA